MAFALFGATRVVDSRTIQRRGDYAPAEKTRLAADPLEQALQTARLGLIIGQQERWADHPQYALALDRAVRAVDERFAMVPEGIVSLPLTIFDQPGQPEVDSETEAFLLARHTVTNAEFQCFVDAGGYQDLALWPEDIWPCLIDFKDFTGEPGPRYWRGGRHDRRLADHPVVGVCYYEAAAFAAWAGFKLPSEAKWQMAASWRLRVAAHQQRRYPWGDHFDVACCNVWASAYGGTLPVNALPRGAAPNGAMNLIGNVWEWTSSDFRCIDRDGRNIVGDTLLKSVRGGAYDTYFPWQAASNFRTGLSALSRVHNVGFRCAMDLLAN